MGAYRPILIPTPTKMVFRHKKFYLPKSAVTFAGADK